MIGKTINLNGESYTVIGVMPRRFKLLSYDASLWVPLSLEPERANPADREVRSLDVIGRLKPAVERPINRQ